MVPIVNRLKAWWEAADRNQRVVTLGGTGALLLLLGGTVFLATRPHYETAFEGLSALEQAQDRDALVAAGIPAEAGENGSIKVPVGQTKEATMKLALAGKLPKDGAHLGFIDLKAVNPMDPPEKQAQTIKAIQEGVIASTLETLDGVAAANVLIAQPAESLFGEPPHPTASITLTENGKGGLTPATGRIIASLVSRAVAKMTPADVFVATSAGTPLWDGQAGGEAGGEKAELDAKASREIESKIRTLLAPLGNENIRVAARADVDTAKRHTHTRTVDPTDRPVQVVTKAETMQGNSQRPGGFAGSTSNMPNASAPATTPGGGSGNSGAYDGKDKSAFYDVSLKEEDVEGGAGDLKGLAVSVTVNTDKVPDIAPVQQIVDGLIGGLRTVDATGAAVPNQAFSATVVGLKFDTSAEQAAKAAADAAAGGQRVQQILSLLPIAAILFVALLVAKQVGKISKAVLPAPAPAVAADGIEGEGMSALPGVEAGFVDADGAPLSLPAGEGAAEAASASFVLEPIRERVDPALEGLKQMATERPEMVATLIKSMMLGERG